MSVSAASDNSITRTPTVDDDADFRYGDNNLPVLRIDEDDAAEFVNDSGENETQVFRLNLTNADWVFGGANGIDNRTALEAFNEAANSANSADWSVKATRRTDTSITVEAKYLGSTTRNYEARLRIPMLTEMDSEGEARVTIDPMNSRLTGGTYTFAIVTDGETTAFVDDVEDISRGRNQTGGTIIIDETTAGALSADAGVTRHGFRLRLPNNFEWNSNTEVNFQNLDVSNDTVEITNNGRDYIVRFDVDSADDVRGSITVDTRVNVTRDANFGEVSVNMTGYGDVSNASNLIIADYLDYGIAFDVEDDGEKEFFAGRLYDNNDDEYEIEFTIEETVDNSFISGRDIDFVLPDWVWILDIELDDDASGNDDAISMDREGENGFSYEVQPGDEELTFNLKFTVNGNAPFADSESIWIEMSGAGIDEARFDLGIAKKPVTVEIAEQEKALSIGTMKQDAPEILVSETEAGALIEGEMLRLQLRETYGGSIRVDSFDVEVVEGDIELTDDDTYASGRGMEVEIDVESTEASTLRFYNIKLDVDRSAPMGDYQIDVVGPAVVENILSDGDLVGRADEYEYSFTWDRDDNDPLRGMDSESELLELILGGRGADFSGRVYRADYVSVGTPIDLQEDVTRERVTMTVGQTTYMVGDEQMTMDAAPFVQDGRLMVPVAHVARALGVSRNAVVWDGDARTVTIYADKVMQMEIGSRTMLVNGVPSDMGAAASIVSDRTFVPVSRFARALGIDYTWDAAAQTVTFHEEE
ncbi:copper amine oxidase N-terminal domain-containing protein [Tindallia magadiensis]|nr:copper amine oxidase N-terminal domain-containing protein [Tindallia magadiensis]